VKTRRVGGANYQVPIEVGPDPDITRDPLAVSYARDAAKKEWSTS